MIKLPIMLRHPNWQDAVSDALLTRQRWTQRPEGAGLPPPDRAVPGGGQEQGGDGQAAAALIDQENVDAERIAVATGDQRELDGINLFDPACPVESSSPWRR